MRTPCNPRLLWRQLGATTRQLLAVLSLSAAGFVGILAREGYSDKAYPDPTRGTSVPTIGFGTTDGVKMGDTTTPVMAVQRALVDSTKFEGALKRCVRVPLAQHEYDTYVSLAYNIGASNFCGSTLVKRLNAQDYAGACRAILDWKYSNGMDCSKPGNGRCEGLWKDRLKLHADCVGGES